MNLSFSPNPVNLISLQAGIDTQPSLTTYTVTRTPNCPKVVAFAISGSTPTFVSLQNSLNVSVQVQVTGATIMDHVSYPLTL